MRIEDVACPCHVIVSTMTSTSTPPLVHPSGPRALPNVTWGGVLQHMRLMHLLYPSKMAQTLCKQGCKAQSPNVGLPCHRPTHCKLLSTTRRSADISTIGGRFDYGVDISTVGWTFQLWGRCFDRGADVSTVGQMFRLRGVCIDIEMDVSTASPPCTLIYYFTLNFLCILVVWILNVLNYNAKYLMQSSPRITGYNRSLTGYDRD